MSVALQSALKRLLEGDVFGFVVETFTSAMPLPVLSLVVFGSIGAGYYITQRSLAIPIVMFVMIGGTTIARAPTVFHQAILGGIVIAVAGIAWVLYNRVRV